MFRHRNPKGARRTVTGAMNQQSATDRSNWAWLRYQAVAWFGVVGAAATLVGHLRGVIQFAHIFEPPVVAWIAVITGAWRRILFFGPTVTASDAVLLSLFSFLVMNSVNASSRPRARLPFAPLLMILAALVFGLIFSSTILIAGVEPEGLITEAYGNSGLPETLFEPLLNAIPEIDSDWLGVLIYFLFTFIVIFFIPLVAAVIAIALLDYAFGVRFNLAAFLVRIWKILFCFAALLVFNYLALWREAGFSAPPNFFDLESLPGLARLGSPMPT
jgi:hypothetical protein